MSKKLASTAEMFEKAIDMAQQAVANVADESLRVAAFKVVLERLLQEREFEFSAISEKGTQAPRVHDAPKKKPKQPKGPKGRVEALIEDHFFAQQRTIGEVKDALAARSWYHKVGDLGITLVRLVQDKKLRRIKEPEKEGGKLVWRYSNW